MHTCICIRTKRRNWKLIFERQTSQTLRTSCKISWKTIKKCNFPYGIKHTSKVISEKCRMSMHELFGNANSWSIWKYWTYNSLSLLSSLLHKILIGWRSHGTTIQSYWVPQKFRDLSTWLSVRVQDIIFSLFLLCVFVCLWQYLLGTDSSTLVGTQKSFDFRITLILF